jgi:hypothetical protein
LSIKGTDLLLISIPNLIIIRIAQPPIPPRSSRSVRSDLLRFPIAQYKGYDCRT